MEETIENKNETKKDNISPPTFPVKNDVKKKSTVTESTVARIKIYKGCLKKIETKKSLTQKAEEKKRKNVQEAVLFEQSKDCLDPTTDTQR